MELELGLGFRGAFVFWIAGSRGLERPLDSAVYATISGLGSIFYMDSRV